MAIIFPLGGVQSIYDMYMNGNYGFSHDDFHGISSNLPRHKLIGGLGGEKARWGQNVQARSIGNPRWERAGCLVDAGGSVV